MQKVQINSDFLDPEKQVPQYFSNNKYTGVAILIIANNQMNLDTIGKCISPFKGGKNKNDLVNNRINYTAFRIDGCPNIQPVPQTEEMNYEEGQERGGFNEQYIKVLRDSIGSSYGFQDKNNYSFDKKVREKSLETLKELKHNEINTIFGDQEAVDKITYMASLIDKLFEAFGKDLVEGLSQKIVKQGSLNQFLSHQIFSDTTFREKFQNILNNCETFKELKKYNCKDVNKSKRELFKELYTIFVELDIPEDEAEKICLELEKNPQSNIVASSELITDATKKKIYGSSLYTNSSLRKYAQLTHYSKSLIYNAREQCRLILNKINDSAKINEEIIKKIFQFSIFDLLKINTINPLKKDVFKIIVECSSYYKAFKKIKYQKKTIQNLGQDQLINISFALKDLFLKINLPFQSWQQAQKNFLSKKFNYISNLQLTNQSYTTLIGFIFDNIQKYYHQQEKQMSYRDEIQLHVFGLLMQTKIQQKMKSGPLFDLATETIESQAYYSQSIEQLGKGDIKEYKSAILANKIFQEFKKNERRDVKEEKYVQQQMIRKHIYEINAKDKIRVHFDAIEAFIKEVIEGDGEIPEEYPSYITNLQSLDKKLNPPEEEEEEEEVTPVKKKPEVKLSSTGKKKGKINPEELKKQFQLQAATFVAAYIKAEEESRFQKGLSEKFSNDPSAYIKKIIQKNAFANPQSTFFTDLGYNGPITRQFKTEFAKNAPQFAAKLKRATQILSILSEASGQGPATKEENSSTKAKGSKGVDKAQLEAEFVNISKTFVAEYITKFEDCILQKGFDKMGKDATKFVRDIIQKGALTNEQSEFFASLGLNGPITRKIKAQFKENATYMSDKLKRCIEIEGLLK